MFEDVREGGTLDRSVSGNGQFESFFTHIFLKPDMTPFLTHNHPSISAKGIDDLPVRKAGDFAHKISSLTVAFSLGWASSSIFSR